MQATLKPTQRAAIQQDYEAASNQLSNPDMAPYVQNKAALQRQVRDMKNVLEEQSAKPYETSIEKDVAASREKELRDRFTADMPSVEEMRRNRNGSVHKHMQWEKKFKPDILEWREITKRLNHDSDDQELTSYERYRPERPFGYDVSAQIAGHHAMSTQAKANWPPDMAEPKAKTAISHIKGAIGKVTETVSDAITTFSEPKVALKD